MVTIGNKKRTKACVEYLITVRTITDQPKFSHVWSSTAIWAASYPYYHRLIVLKTNLK